MFWQKKKHKFFFKASDDVLSFCQCENEPAMSSGQLDCPWCGCGWMIACSRCTKSYVFAEVRETDIPLAELARREAKARGREVTKDDIQLWIEEMTEMLSHFDVGDTVVYLDGAYWVVDSTQLEFDGIFATHKFDRLPHADALNDPPILRTMLGDKKYWLDREDIKSRLRRC